MSMIGSVAADIPAGLGYLAGGLAVAGVAVALITNRRRFGSWMVDYYVSAAGRATAKRPWAKWVYHAWVDPRWQDEQFRAKSIIWLWLPFAVFLPFVAVVMIAAAIAEFGR